MIPIAHGPHPGHVGRYFYTPLPLTFFAVTIFTNAPPVSFRHGEYFHFPRRITCVGYATVKLLRNNFSNLNITLEDFA